jgi:uncharacterized protein (UPF0548 family)
MFLARVPSPPVIERFLADSAQLPLSYKPIGLAKQPTAGFTLDEEITVVGAGTAAFDRARRALAGWRHFETGWTRLYPPNAPVVPGTVIAIVIRHLGFWSINGGRIVYTLDSSDGTDFGFAYGTLANHAEAGEEIFRVALHPDGGQVEYTIRAASRPRSIVTKAGYPVTRLLQSRFRRDSSMALRRAVEHG